MANGRTVSRPNVIKLPLTCLGCGKRVRLGHEHSTIGEHPICSPQCYANVKAADDETAAICSEPTVIRFEYYNSGYHTAG